MFCPNCGADVGRGSNYCSECGSKVSGESEGSKSTENSSENKEVNGSSNQDKEESTNTKDDEHNVAQNIDFDKSRFLLVLITAIVVSVVCFSFVFSLDADAIPVGNEILGPTSPLDADTDNDGLKDGVELKAYDTDPLKPDTDGDGLEDGRELNELNTDPADSDTDDDGISDRREVEELNTNPIKSDTDSDGLNDSVEVSGDTDVLDSDTDSDGLEDGRELEIGTNPLVEDTDKDGLEDGSEVNEYNSNPLVVDTDSDNLSDETEVKEFGTDPASPDTDDDGLEDNLEIRDYNTNATVQDTDNDSLDDGTEVNKGTNPLVKDTDKDGLVDGNEVDIGSNPLQKDSDKDGLKDGVEVNNYGTSPTESDTDGDGVDDEREIDLDISPTDSDTDGDGLPDGFEKSNRTNFQSDLNPMHKDMLVELDTDSGTNVPRELGLVVNEFSNAPISNPDGEQGIELHIYYNSDSSINTKDTQSIDYYRDNAYESAFDLKGYGFYHALIIDNVSGESVGGITSPSIDGMLIQESSDNNIVSSRFAHELGHQLGLLPDDFSGIDSRKYTFDSYPSAMNYVCRNQNRLLQPSDCGVVKYSTGEGFNDWNHIEDSLPRVAPSTENIG
jgi:hypothetical protein